MVQNDSNTQYPVGDPATWCDQLSIPIKLLSNTGLSTGEKVVYIALVACCTGPHCYRSIHTIANRAGMSYNSAEKHLLSLEALGLIETKRRKKDTNQYALLLHPALKGNVYSSTPKLGTNTKKEVPRNGVLELTIGGKRVPIAQLPPDCDLDDAEYFSKDKELNTLIRRTSLRHARRKTIDPLSLS